MSNKETFKCLCKNPNPKWKCPCETRDFKLLQPIPNSRAMILKNNTYANIKDYKKKSTELHNLYFSSIKKTKPATAAAPGVEKPSSDTGKKNKQNEAGLTEPSIDINEVQKRLDEMNNEKRIIREEKELKDCMDEIYNENKIDFKKIKNLYLKQVDINKFRNYDTMIQNLSLRNIQHQREAKSQHTCKRKLCKNQFESTFTGSMSKSSYNHVKFNELFKSGMSLNNGLQSSIEETPEQYGCEESLVNIMPTNLMPSNLGLTQFPLSARTSTQETTRFKLLSPIKTKEKDQMNATGRFPDLPLQSHRLNQQSHRQYHNGNHQALMPLEPTKLLKSSRNHHQRLTLIDRENSGPRSPKNQLNNHQGILNIETHNHLLTNIIESTSNYRAGDSSWQSSSVCSPRQMSDFQQSDKDIRIQQLGTIWNKSKSFRTQNNKLKNRSIRRLEKLKQKEDNNLKAVNQGIYDVNQIQTELKTKNKDTLCQEKSKEGYMDVVQDAIEMYIEFKHKDQKLKEKEEVIR